MKMIKDMTKRDWSNLQKKYSMPEIIHRAIRIGEKDEEIIFTPDSIRLVPISDFFDDEIEFGCDTTLSKVMEMVLIDNLLPIVGASFPRKNILYPEIMPPDWVDKVIIFPEWVNKGKTTDVVCTRHDGNFVKDNSFVFVYEKIKTESGCRYFSEWGRQRFRRANNQEIIGVNDCTIWHYLRGRTPAVDIKIPLYCF